MRIAPLGHWVQTCTVDWMLSSVFRVDHKIKRDADLSLDTVETECGLEKLPHDFWST